MSGADPDGLDEGPRKEQLWWWTYNKPRHFGALLRTHATRYLLEHQSAPCAPTPQPAGRRTLTGGKPHVPPSLAEAAALTAVQRTACGPG
jgi:hypothetical protein